MIKFIKNLLKLLVIGIFVPKVGDTIGKIIIKILLTIGLLLAVFADRFS